MTRRARGSGSIYQRADGRWTARVHDAAGKRIDLYAETKKEVTAKLREAERALEQGAPVRSSDKLTVALFLGRWIESTTPTIRPSTALSYRQIVKLHLIPTLGHLSLAQLRPDHVDELLRAKLATGLSPRTVTYIRAVLRRALGQAVRWGLIGRNVATLVDPPRQVRTEISPLDPAECRRLLKQVRGDRLEGLYTVALASGLRQGELFGLQWPDVDLAGSSLAVRRSWGLTATGLDFVEPKSERSRRTLQLPALAVAALRAHRKRQLAERLLVGEAWRGKDFDLVFCTPIGTPLDSRNVTHAFQRHLAKAGIPRRRFHDLRHSAATLLLLQGVSPRVVQEILGHSSVTLTLGTYSHVLPSLERDAADRMDAALRKGAAS
jgi:integrase